MSNLRRALFMTIASVVSGAAILYFVDNTIQTPTPEKNKKQNTAYEQLDSLGSKTLSFNHLGHYVFNYQKSAGLECTVAGDFDNDGDLDLAIIGGELGESYSHLLHVTFIENKVREKPPRLLLDDAVEPGR